MRINGYVSAKSLPIYEALMEAINDMFKQWKSFNDDPGLTYGIMYGMQTLAMVMAMDGTELTLTDEAAKPVPDTANYD